MTDVGTPGGGVTESAKHLRRSGMVCMLAGGLGDRVFGRGLHVSLRRGAVAGRRLERERLQDHACFHAKLVGRTWRLP